MNWSKVAGLLAFAAFALGGAGILLQRVGTDVIPQDRYVVEAQVADAVALGDAADVRQAGVKIGRVKDIKNAGQVVALRLEIDPKYGPFYRDATTRVRAKTIAEENYLEVDPGTPSAGPIPEDGVLPLSRNLEAVQNDDVFSIFDRARREDVQGTLQGTATALQGDGAGDLNDTLGSMSDVVDGSEELADVLAAQRAQVARLIDSFGTVTAALGERSAALRSFTVSARREAEAVAARDAALRSTLDRLPRFLDQGRATAARLTRLSGNATPVLDDLRVATEALVPTVRDLRPAAVSGQRALASLQKFARTGTPAVRQLEPFGDALAKFTPSYDLFVRDLGPAVRAIKPYAAEVGSWFALASAATKVDDSIGHVARVLLPISLSSLPGALPPEVEDLLKQYSGSLDTRGSNPYPKPGQAARPTPHDGSYTRVERDPAPDAKG